MKWKWISSDLNHFGFSSVKDFQVFLEIGFWFRRYWITQARCFSPSRGLDLIRDEVKWIISLSPGSDYFRFSSDNFNSWFFNRILDLVYIELDVFIVGHRRLTYIHLRDEIRSGWKKNNFFMRDITNAPSSMLCKHEILTERNVDNAILFQADYFGAPLTLQLHD